MTEMRDQLVENEETITAHRTCPGRTVFTESENADGWIATDLTVEPTE